MRKAWLANLVRISGAFPDAVPPTPRRPPRLRAPWPPPPPGPGPAAVGQRDGGVAGKGGPAGARDGGFSAPDSMGQPPGAAWGARPAKSHGVGDAWGFFLLNICAAVP